MPPGAQRSGAPHPRASQGLPGTEGGRGLRGLAGDDGKPKDDAALPALSVPFALRASGARADQASPGTGWQAGRGRGAAATVQR